MNKCLKTTATWLILVFLATSLLTGCSQNSDSGELKTSTSGVVQQDSTLQEKPMKPKLLKWYTETDEVANKNLYKTDVIAQAFQDKHPDVQVEIKPLVANTNSQEYLKKVDLMLASGEQIDIINFSNATYVAAKVNSGILEPLDEYAKKETIKLEDEYNGIMKINGKVYTIPNQFSSWIVFINKDMLDAAGLPLPPLDWTWDDYRRYAKELTKGEGKDKVYGSYFHTWAEFNAVGYQSKIIDSPYYKADGTANFDNPVFKSFMQFRFDLENTDKTQISFIDVKTQKMAYRNIFFGSKAAMMPQGTWMLANIKDMEKYPHTFKTTFAALPRADSTCTPNTTYNTAGGCGYAVNAKSEFKQEAYDLIRFITSEGYDLSKAYLSPWKKGNHEAIAKELMGTETTLYDMDVYKKVVNDPNWKENTILNVKPYDQEVISIYSEECEKYFVGGQSLDDAIINMQSRSNDVISKNSK